MNNWNSLVVSLWGGKFNSDNLNNGNMKTFKTFGNHDTITISSIEGNTPTQILGGMWHQTNLHSQNIKAGESIHNLFAVSNSNKCYEFWEKDVPFLFISAIQINFDNNSKFESQFDNFKKELNEILKAVGLKENIDYIIYNSLDCGDILLFLKSEKYIQGANLIHKITIKSKYKHYSYSVCGINLKLALKKLSKEDEIIPKVSVCAVLAEATYYNDWFKSFVSEYPIKFTSNTDYTECKTKEDNLKSIKYNEYIHLARLGNEDICINIYNCQLYHFLKMACDHDGIFSYNNTLTKITFSRLRVIFDTDIYDITPIKKREISYGRSLIHSLSEKWENVLKQLSHPYVHKAISELLAASENLEYKEFAFEVQDCIRNVFPLFVKKINKFNSCNSSYSNYDFNNDLTLFTTGLMSIANGSLHADKLFINVPGFNAVTCDVPAKLLVYYTAYIQKLVSALNDETELEYKFLLCPDLYMGIEVVPLFNYKNNESQLLKARIPIKKLFDPKVLLMELSHEAAHFVGSKIRKRRERVEYLAEIIAYTIADRLVRPKVYDISNIENCYNINPEYEKSIILSFLPESCESYSIDKLLTNKWKEIPEFIKSELLQNFNNDDSIYMENINQKFIDNACLLLSDTCTKKLINKVLQVIIGNASVEMMDNILLLSRILERHVYEILTDEYLKIINRACLLCSESFADLVMLYIIQDPDTYLYNIYESETDALFKIEGENIYSWNFYEIAEMRIERIISVLDSLNYTIAQINRTDDSQYNDFLDHLELYTNAPNEDIRATSILSLEANTNYLKICADEIKKNEDVINEIRKLYRSVINSENLDKCICEFRKCAFEFRTGLMTTEA